MQHSTSRFFLLVGAALLLSWASGCDDAGRPKPDSGAYAEQGSDGAAEPGAGADSVQPGSPDQGQPEARPVSAPVFTADRLQQLVAPIALYPDPLLTEILVAATYPAEVTEAAAWVKQNPALTGNELDAALAEKGWDLSITSLVHAPKALALMAADPVWTRDLGDAFLAQQDDVLNAVQVMRLKACDLGHLETTAEQKVIVEPRPAEPAPAPAPVQTTPTYQVPAPQYVVPPPPRIVRIIPARPDVFYVPSYNPRVIYGPPPPTIYYPQAMLYPAIGVGVAPIISFGIGFTVGALLWGDVDWYGGRICSHRYRDRYYNNYRDYHDNYRWRERTWRHDPHHRHGVVYRNRDVARYYTSPSYRRGDDRRPPSDRRHPRDLDRPRSHERDRPRSYERDRPRDYERDRGRQPPELGRSRPDAGSPRPQGPKPRPEVGRPRPEVGKGRPQVGKPHPQPGKPRPEVGKPRPETGKTRPEVGKPRPEVGKGRPQLGKPHPQLGKPRPEVGKPRPETGKTRPEVGNGRSQVGKPHPQPGKPREEAGQQRGYSQGSRSPSNRDLERQRGGSSPSAQRPSMGGDHGRGGGSSRPPQGRGSASGGAIGSKGDSASGSKGSGGRSGGESNRGGQQGPGNRGGR